MLKLKKSYLLHVCQWFVHVPTYTTKQRVNTIFDIYVFKILIIMILRSKKNNNNTEKYNLILPTTNCSTHIPGIVKKKLNNNIMIIIWLSSIGLIFYDSNNYYETLKHVIPSGFMI